MRLLTHNMLQSNVRGTTNGYPLNIEVENAIIEESPVETELIKRLLPKIDYKVLKRAIQQISSHLPLPVLGELPERLSEDIDDETVLSLLHTVLMDVHVLEGHLVCPDSGRKFPIKQGIPNMILHEDEI
mmetsp:Transcript_18724/g.20875  ORF Transcript_18724/g.20875 Transcript_18724/m.20875 type:complete len:129 (+) Transcript_18724:63-449(+)